MEESVRHLLEECQNIKNSLEKDLVQSKGEVFENTNLSLLKTNAVLIPLEINIRRIELKLKRLKLELKESEPYQAIKTMKAKDEQVVLDTYDISEALLDLKLERNKLRANVTYLEYQVRLKLGEVE